VSLWWIYPILGLAVSIVLYKLAKSAPIEDEHASMYLDGWDEDREDL